MWTSDYKFIFLVNFLSIFQKVMFVILKQVRRDFNISYIFEFIYIFEVPQHLEYIQFIVCLIFYVLLKIC